MILHSDTLTPEHLKEACRFASERVNGVRPVKITRVNSKGSRTHRAAYEVILTGSNSRRQSSGEDYAATHDEWGWFLAYLYDNDANMKSAYKDSADFQKRTDWAYDTD